MRLSNVHLFLFYEEALLESFPFSELKRAGYPYSFFPETCKNCFGNCCCGVRGNVWVNQREIRKISLLLQVNPIDFVLTYCWEKDKAYVLKEFLYDRNHICVFFDRERGRCSIYEARPIQCQTYPFWEYYKTHPEEIIKECQGVRCQI